MQTNVRQLAYNKRWLDAQGSVHHEHMDRPLRPWQRLATPLLLEDGLLPVAHKRVNNQRLQTAPPRLVHPPRANHDTLHALRHDLVNNFPQKAERCIHPQGIAAPLVV